MFPRHIAVVGGGRWARVYIDVLCALVSAETTISVHTRRNGAAVEEWARSRGLRDRIAIATAPPDQLDPRTSAAIVVNAAREHEETAVALLRKRVPTLVEKPIALTHAGAQRMIEAAASSGAPLAAAQVLLFAPYLDRFGSLVADAGPLETVRIDWADPAAESRYGERKSFDAGVPIYADIFPHLVAIVRALSAAPLTGLTLTSVERGGAALELSAALGNAMFGARVERNAPGRRRSIDVMAGGQRLVLDFAAEPGVIRLGNTESLGDENWATGPRPLVRLLSAFSEFARNGTADPRLNVQTAVHACALMDQAAQVYRAALTPWLIGRLESDEPTDSDLHYALAERLQSENALPPDALERQIASIRSSLKHRSNPEWQRSLRNAGPEEGRVLRQLGAGRI